MRVGGERQAPGRFTPGKDAVHIVQEAEWGLGAALKRCGKSRPHRDLIPRPSDP
jgi:hypothetical protein